jgi:hypothetical protein
MKADNFNSLEKRLEDLESFLRTRMADKSRIISDISNVQSTTQPKPEPEGLFIKRELAPLLKEFFHDDLLVIEGNESKGETSFKNLFFGNRPAADLIIKGLDIVGEIKYAKLSPRTLGHAVGQAIVYMESSKQESVAYLYGLVIYFTLQNDLYEFTASEKILIDRLWRDEHVRVIML